MNSKERDLLLNAAEDQNESGIVFSVGSWHYYSIQYMFKTVYYKRAFFFNHPLFAVMRKFMRYVVKIHKTKNKKLVMVKRRNKTTDRKEKTALLTTELYFRCYSIYIPVPTKRSYEKYTDTYCEKAKFVTSLTASSKTSHPWPRTRNSLSDKDKKGALTDCRPSLPISSASSISRVILFLFNTAPVIKQSSAATISAVHSEIP